jgi:hypothetical protein
VGEPNEPAPPTATAEPEVEVEVDASLGGDAQLERDGAGHLMPDAPSKEIYEHVPTARAQARTQVLWLGGMSAIIGVLLLLSSVSVPGTWNPNIPDIPAMYEGIQTRGGPTPWGYIRGMAIYLIPGLAGFYMLRQLRAFQLYQRTLFWAAGIMFVAIFILDILLVGGVFFHFPNNGAYLFWIKTWDVVDWEVDYVPIEDVVFYFLAIGCTMIVYVWAMLYWFPRASPYHRDGRMYPAASWKYVKSFDLSWQPVVLGVVLVIAAFYLQRHMHTMCANPRASLVHQQYCLQSGMETAKFPWYWTFLVCTAVVPTAVMGRRVGNLVNWPALSFCTVAMVLISVILSITTALPYQWWSFEDDVMIGVYFNTWYGVPLEQLVLYCITPIVTAFWLELIHAWLYRKGGLEDHPGEPVADPSLGLPRVIPGDPE